jgi:hypothetical protein
MVRLWCSDAGRQSGGGGRDPALAWRCWRLARHSAGGRRRMGSCSAGAPSSALRSPGHPPPGQRGQGRPCKAVLARRRVFRPFSGLPAATRTQRGAMRARRSGSAPSSAPLVSAAKRRLCSLAVLAALLCHASAQRAVKPNIIVILTVWGFEAETVLWGCSPPCPPFPGAFHEHALAVAAPGGSVAATPHISCTGLGCGYLYAGRPRLHAEQHSSEVRACRAAMPCLALWLLGPGPAEAPEALRIVARMYVVCLCDAVALALLKVHAGSQPVPGHGRPAAAQLPHLDSG